MSNEILQEIACPNCQNPIDVREHGRHVACDACSSRFILRGHLCPGCGAYHAQEKSFCGNCGQALQRVCRNCSAANWTGDEYCVNCGNAMDIFDLLAMEHKRTSQEAVERRREEIRRLKELEDLASAERMQALQAIEERRLADLHRRRQKQKQQERQMLLLAFGLVVIFLLVLLVYTAVSLLF